MSSLFVRDAIKQFCATEFPTETYIDLTSQFETVKDVLKAYNLSMDAKWMGVDFIADPEIPVALNAGNTAGAYRESGSVSFFFVAPAAVGPQAREILTRGEALKKAIRGKRFGTMTVQEVIGPNTGQGATLNYDHGFISSVVTIAYEYDITPSP